MERPLCDIVTDALKRWIEVAGIDLSVLDPERKSLSFGEWDQKQEIETLQKMWDLDPSGLTTLMLIRGSFEEFLRDTKFSALDLILGPTDIQETLAPMIAMRGVVEDPDVVELIDSFRTTLKDATEHYGAEFSDDYESWFDDKLAMAQIRRDALLGVENLECHQFTKGDGATRPMGFNRGIYEFWNINSLLGSMRSQIEPGITLCLIRDPVDVLSSYFVFAMKNGDNIIILTDRAKVPHPDFNRMSRSRVKGRSRDFMDRAGKFWLPYDLLDLGASEDQKILYAKARTSLVPFNAKGVRLAEFKDLHPSQMFWLSMMFELINERFWREGRVARQLSYTGEMVVEPHALVGEHGALVREGHYKPLELAPIKAADLKGMHEDKQWQIKPSEFNHWMVERYEGGVPDEALNVVGDNKVPQLVDSLREQGLLAPDTRDDWEKRVVKRDDGHGVRHLEPTNFGTAEDLDKDRHWAARMNQSRVIQQLAQKEFDKEVEQIRDWYESHVRKREEFLLDAAAKGELVLPAWKGETFKDGFLTTIHSERNEWIRDIDVLWQTGKVNDVWKMPHTDYSKPWGKSISFGGWDGLRDRWLCCERDVRASVVTGITVNCPEAIAALLQMEVKDLPWALQHLYHGEPPYHGNPILDRLDPEDWVLKNPWRKLNLHIRIFQSKNALHARRKRLGLPRKKWE